MVRPDNSHFVSMHVYIVYALGVQRVKSKLLISDIVLYLAYNLFQFRILVTPLYMGTWRTRGIGTSVHTVILNHVLLLHSEKKIIPLLSCKEASLSLFVLGPINGFNFNYNNS